MHSIVCDLITHPFAAIENWEWISIFAKLNRSTGVGGPGVARLRSNHHSTGPLSDLRYRQVRLDWWSTLRMRARQAPLPPTTADCHLDYFPVCMPPRPTVYGWHCGSEIRWHQPDGCQHRVDTSPILTHYAMFIRNIQQWYDKMVLW